MLQLILNLLGQLEQTEAVPTAIAFSQRCLCFSELEWMSPQEKLEQEAEAIAPIG